MVRNESHFIDPAYARTIGPILITLGEATKHLHITTNIYSLAIREIAYLRVCGRPQIGTSACYE